MEKKSFFDEIERYKQEAIEMDEQVYDLLNPIINHYKFSGYSLREMQIIINNVANSLVSEKLIQR